MSRDKFNKEYIIDMQAINIILVYEMILYFHFLNFIDIIIIINRRECKVRIVKIMMKIRAKGIYRKREREGPGKMKMVETTNVLVGNLILAILLYIRILKPSMMAKYNSLYLRPLKR